MLKKCEDLSFNLKKSILTVGHIWGKRYQGIFKIRLNLTLSSKFPENVVVPIENFISESFHLQAIAECQPLTSLLSLSLRSR